MTDFLPTEICKSSQKMRAEILKLISAKAMSSRSIALEINKSRQYTHNLIRKMVIKKEIQPAKRGIDPDTGIEVAFWSAQKPQGLSRINPAKTKGRGCKKGPTKIST